MHEYFISFVAVPTVVAPVMALYVWLRTSKGSVNLSDIFPVFLNRWAFVGKTAKVLIVVVFFWLVCYEGIPRLYTWRFTQKALVSEQIAEKNRENELARLRGQMTELNSVVESGEILSVNDKTRLNNLKVKEAELVKDYKPSITATQKPAKPQKPRGRRGTVILEKWKEWERMEFSAIVYQTPNGFKITYLGHALIGKIIITWDDSRKTLSGWWEEETTREASGHRQNDGTTTLSPTYGKNNNVIRFEGKSNGKRGVKILIYHL